MTLKDQLAGLRARAERASALLTEEATKNALVMPMLRALGYDVFDPTIVVPEFCADFGTKKGEKVDYAIRVGNDVAILIECKPAQSDLHISHASQLFRYFSVTKARFGVLTNGIEWRFFTDLDVPNKMDERPFFVFSCIAYNEEDLLELEKFAAANFSIDGILTAASDLKLKSLIVGTLRTEFTNPSDDFVRMIAKRVHDKNITAEVRSRFHTLIVACIVDILRDQANQRLKDAIDRQISPNVGAIKVADAHTSEPQSESIQNASSITTTPEELDAFRIIQAIVRRNIDVKRIFLRDASSYCAILCDDNNRRPIARLYLSGKKKRIGIFSSKIETKFDIEDLEDIYKLADQLHVAIEPYSSIAE